jgi:hypothetical protein
VTPQLPTPHSVRHRQANPRNNFSITLVSSEPRTWVVGIEERSLSGARSHEVLCPAERADKGESGSSLLYRDRACCCERAQREPFRAQLAQDRA